MPENQPSFTVTDKRKFTLEGDVREGFIPTEETSSAAIPPTPAATQPISSTAAQPSEEAVDHLDRAEEAAESAEEAGGDYDDLGPAPSAQESADQHTAYRKSSGQIDDMLRQANPGAPHPPEMDFEQLVQSIYLSAVLAMGAETPAGQKPRIDIVGARQSIDMLGVLSDKTKGNLNPREEKLLQSALFNLRMMFLEITNSITAAAKSKIKNPRP